MAVEAFNELPEDVQIALDRLQSYTSPTPEHSIASLPDKYASYPRPRFAAVLVLLYYKPDGGGLRVLLTTRSKELRSHPGQAALPGGKSDEEDETPVRTAFREACEEIGLPTAPHPLAAHIQVLALLPPQLSLFRLLVTPVVAFCHRPDLILPILKANEAEVAGIFDHPLEAFLDPDVMKRDGERLVEKGEDWIYEDELHSTTDLTWLNNSSYRMHRFRSSSTPIKGLTADILILTAQIASARNTTYSRHAPNQTEGFGPAIEWVMEEARAAGTWIKGPRVDGKTEGSGPGQQPDAAASRFAEEKKAVENAALARVAGTRDRDDKDLGPYTPNVGLSRVGTPAPPS
ncbi:hypothetical protein FS837_004115 [Tulasnella sp. UAMH 9824]|nr:hypothetical protein FS837_004115 [Tulasnella sp. UAMH 9824]